MREWAPFMGNVRWWAPNWSPLVIQFHYWLLYYSTTNLPTWYCLMILLLGDNYLHRLVENASAYPSSHSTPSSSSHTHSHAIVVDGGVIAVSSCSSCSGGSSSSNSAIDSSPHSLNHSPTPYSWPFSILYHTSSWALPYPSSAHTLIIQSSGCKPERVVVVVVVVVVVIEWLEEVG